MHPPSGVDQLIIVALWNTYALLTKHLGNNTFITLTARLATLKGEVHDFYKPSWFVEFEAPSWMVKVRGSCDKPFKRFITRRHVPCNKCNYHSNAELSLRISWPEDAGYCWRWRQGSGGECQGHAVPQSWCVFYQTQWCHRQREGLQTEGWEMQGVHVSLASMAMSTDSAYNKRYVQVLARSNTYLT